MDLSKLKFETDRLLVQNWRSTLRDATKRAALEHALEPMLTPNITHFLPLSMQFVPSSGAITEWVSARDAEADILCIHARASGALAGLVILSDQTVPGQISTLHLGYFLGEATWGKGYATEVISGLLAQFHAHGPVRFEAGVDANNVASARVLEKAGFRLIPDRSTADRGFFEVLIGQRPDHA